MQRSSTILFALFLFVFPASNNYALRDFTWGSGGTDASTSTSYALEGNLGELSSAGVQSGSYQVWPGLLFTQMSNVPSEPILSVTGEDYHRLHIIIDSANNPTDTEFAIAISDDDFVTTRFVQSDNTVGSTLGDEDWQAYADWGGGTGEYIVGLDANTEYQVKVKARQGSFSESPWGPIAAETTDSLTLTFDIDVASTDSESSAPYILDFGTLVANSISTTDDRVWIDVSTNASSGALVYVYSTNEGLYSVTAGHTISAVSGNLSSLDEGFGLQSASVAESSGGPLTELSPYDGTSEVVGTVLTTPSALYSSSQTPIVNGRGSFIAKAKVAGVTPAADDYAETLTVIAAGVF